MTDGLRRMSWRRNTQGAGRQYLKGENQGDHHATPLGPGSSKIAHAYNLADYAAACRHRG